MDGQQLHGIQKAYFLKGRTRSAEFRIRQVKSLKQAVLKYEPQILEAVKMDMGRPAHEAYASEVLMIVKEINYAVRHLRSMMRPKRVRTSFMHLPGKSRILPEPFGNVLIIGPWNYPFQLLLVPLVGAIMAGNTAVLKVPETAKRSAEVILEMIGRCFEPEYVAAVAGDVRHTQELLAQPFNHIFFTGSVSVGKIVMEHASANLVPVTLELGGKNPCIVEPDTRMETAARRICWGKFFNAGQTCVAPDYVLVHESAKETLLAALKTAITEFYGNNARSSKDYGRIVNDQHFERLCGLLKNQKIFSGGGSDRSQRFMAPTVLVDVSPDSPIMQEEIFGPLLPVLTYSSLDEAIDFIRRRPKPLAIYLFSENKATQRKVLRNTSSGSVNINETFSQVASTTLPFGGVGNSGMGRYHGKESFKTFSHYKSVLYRAISFDARLKYPPYRMPLRKMKRFMRIIF